MLEQGQTVLARLAKDVQPAPADGLMLQGRGAAPLDAAASWAQSIAHSPDLLERFVNQAKKTRSFGARNVLAYAATRGRMDWRAMQTLLAARRLDPEDYAVRSAAEGFSIPGARALARVLFCQRIREDDLHNALALYEAIQEQHGRGVLESVDCSYLADLMVTFARQPEVVRVLDHQQETTTNRRLSQALLQVNAANPFIAGARCNEQQWLAELNALLAAGGLAPVGLAEGSEPAFYRLHGTPAPLQQQMPLVTVIMPIYEPDESTSAAVDSLLAQTWTNLEILIVDDGSPAVDDLGRATGYGAFLEELAGRDPRIRLILNEENRGAYWARNDAYAVAAGKYVTVADKDDWHHPQKIQMQAQDLEMHPDRPANMVQWTRVDEDLRFLFRWGPDRVIHPSFASIMYRREEVQSKLGYWDNVRKSADNEFRMRLQAVYGERIAIISEMPLAFSLLGESNLTSQDFGLGYEQSERRIYRYAYESWHRSIAEARESAYLPMRPDVRKFPAPGNFLPVKTAPNPLDVVYVSDYEYSDREARALALEVAAVAASGLSVGIVPAESFLRPQAKGAVDRGGLESLIAQGTVREIALSQAMHAALVVIRNPVIFQVARDAPAALTSDRVLIRASDGPLEKETCFRRYDVATVDATVHAVFGVQPQWCGTADDIQDELRRLLPAARLADSPMPDYVGAGTPDLLQPQLERSPLPILGRHMPDNAGSWPATMDDFHGAFCTAAAFPVQVLGTAEFPLSRFFSGALPEHWDVVDSTLVPVGTFLDRIDFLVHFPAVSGGDGAFEIAEALAHGVVCILPASYAALYGDAAVYCRPDEVEQTIRRLWNDSEAYQTLQRRGIALINKRVTFGSVFRSLPEPAR